MHTPGEKASSFPAIQIMRVRFAAAIERVNQILAKTIAKSWEDRSNGKTCTDGQMIPHFAPAFLR
jgi:hypothetical protein